MTETADFAAEGLLDGLEGPDRDARERLLAELLDDGVSLAELRAAVAEGRLALVPVERVLAGDKRYSATEVAELSGVEVELLQRQWRAFGMVVPSVDEPVLSSNELEAAHRTREMLDAGLEPDAILELGRTIAVAMSAIAAAVRQTMASTFARSGDTEHEVASRLAEQTRQLSPLVGPSLEHVYRLQLLEQLRHAALDAVQLRRGETEVTEQLTIGFADLVGFTRLGEELQPEDLVAVTGRLDELAGEVATGPVRLVKLIGDAAMLASPDPVALLDAINELLERMAAEEELPLIRAGVACGPVLPRGGDLYGQPVNLASRITSIARPGSVLVDAEVRDAVGEDRYRFSRAGARSLKGISKRALLYRVRPLENDGGPPGD